MLPETHNAVPGSICRRGGSQLAYSWRQVFVDEEARWAAPSASHTLILLHACLRGKYSSCMGITWTHNTKKLWIKLLAATLTFICRSRGLAPTKSHYLDVGAHGTRNWCDHVVWYNYLQPCQRSGKKTSLWVLVRVCDIQSRCGLSFLERLSNWKYLNHGLNFSSKYL